MGCKSSELLVLFIPSTCTSSAEPAMIPMGK